MNPLTPTLQRWLKVNFVGALGMALQLTTLALLNHIAPTHYLLTSAAAVELTILHNFLWHLHYTWRDRRDTTPRLTQLLRFHLSNGLVSLLGNLILMRLLVHQAHLPLLAANLTAILVCSFLNFYFGNTWAFPAET
jgi:putative flippase GtrA